MIARSSSDEARDNNGAAFGQRPPNHFCVNSRKSRIQRNSIRPQFDLHGVEHTGFDASFGKRESKQRTISVEVCTAQRNSASGRTKKAGILGSGLLDHEMVAGVRFELTTFGL